MRKKYLRFEQLEVFRPMPVPAAIVMKIRQESEKAKQLAKQQGDDDTRPATVPPIV